MVAPETLLPNSLFIDLDRSGPVPLYYQVATRLEQAIRDETLGPGARLENEIALGNRLGLSRPTIRRAIQELVDKGLLVRRRGIGTQVVAGKVSRPVALTSLFDDLANEERKPETTVLSYERIPAPAEISEVLGLPQDGPVLHLRRLRTANGVAVAILENFLPASADEPSASELESHGLYQLLRGRGVTVQVAKQRISARTANDEEADLLDVEHRGALLTMERTAFDASGRAIEFGRHVYRPDLYAFESTVVN